MKFSCFDMGLEVELCENSVNVLVIENPSFFSELLERLMKQKVGEDAGILFAENADRLQMSKFVEIIHTPMLIELNSKRILNYMYKELGDICDLFYADEKQKINTMIVDLLDKVAEKEMYPITFNLNTEFSALLKLYDVRLDYQNESLLEKLLDSIKLEKMLCGTRIIILVNIKSFFSVEQLIELYKCAIFNKVQLILLEATQKEIIQYEKCCIIDKDRCYIHT